MCSRNPLLCQPGHQLLHIVSLLASTSPNASFESLPVNEGISWQAHLFGAIGGIAAGMLITSDDPPALRAKREAKKAEKLRSEQPAPAATAPQQQATPQNPGFSGNPPQSGPFYNPPRG